jgi:hypothetical protein
VQRRTGANGGANEGRGRTHASHLSLSRRIIVAPSVHVALSSWQYGQVVIIAPSVGVALSPRRHLRRRALAVVWMRVMQRQRRGGTYGVAPSLVVTPSSRYRRRVVVPLCRHIVDVFEAWRTVREGQREERTYVHVVVVVTLSWHGVVVSWGPQAAWTRSGRASREKGGHVRLLYRTIGFVVAFVIAPSSV